MSVTGPLADPRTDAIIDPISDLRAAECSNGAPSARNLIVTVFGDLLGPDREVSVQQLTELLAGFGVNERLVRTSLSRITADGLLAARAVGRRSFYRIAPDASTTFANADRRIYRGDDAVWDGSWTIVVLDGGESTASRRAKLRRELTWAGLGTVAPNVLASPVVAPDTVTDVIARVGGFDHVLVTRSHVVEAEGTLGHDVLMRRSADVDEVERGYHDFADRFERFDADVLARLDDTEALKARLLLVSTFRRVALADPQFPSTLVPAGWSGRRARAAARRVYAAVAPAADRHATRVLGDPVTTDPHRFP